MAKKEIYEQKAEALITPILVANKLELVDMEYVKEGGSWYLRAYIDKPGGVNIDDCEVTSRAFSDALDKEDFIEEAYILEVSSPGLTRPLKKPKDFERNLGKEVEIKFFRMMDGQKEIEGTLVAYDDHSVTIQVEDNEKTIEKKDIALIRPAIFFD